LGADPPPHEEPAGLDTKLWIVRTARAIVGFIYVVVVAELVLLALGFALRLFGASTDAQFTRWVYRNVDRAMEPFRGMFPTRAVSDQSIFDASLLFAMIVYAIVGITLHAVVTWLAGVIVGLRREQQLSRRRRRDVGGTTRTPLPPDRPVGP
jgi:uncharacterized protein YggT (Ycf19 family)